jgi:hypothetical protein
MKLAEAEGYYADLQFFRCNDRSKIPPVAITFSREGADGKLLYGIPNVTAILDSPEERLRGDNSPSGKKLVRAVDGTAANQESGVFGGKVRFEEFSSPARVLLSESTDSELHRPFDVAAQYSSSVRDEAVRRMAVSFADSSQFSFLKDCVVHPEITKVLSRYTPMFGARETAQVQDAKLTSNGILQLMVANPEDLSGQPILLRVELSFIPAAFCKVSFSELD